MRCPMGVTAEGTPSMRVCQSIYDTRFLGIPTISFQKNAKKATQRSKERHDVSWKLKRHDSSGKHSPRVQASPQTGVLAYCHLSAEYETERECTPQGLRQDLGSCVTRTGLQPQRKRAEKKSSLKVKYFHPKKARKMRGSQQSSD